jgi:uncharacterized protein YndB with AHSA1/START domain
LAITFLSFGGRFGTATVIIDRPADAVFDFLADGTNNRRWREAVVEIAKVSGEGQGAVYSQTRRGPGGRPIKGDYRITEFDRPRRLAFQVIAGPGRPKGTFDVEPHGAGTRVTFTLELRHAGIMRLMAPVISRQVRREVDSLNQLKMTIESEDRPSNS